ncbi:MAG TPA: peptide ABC transporter substrate-binding protein [Symbiobacteriaceae bacterium]|nr:peptide ABC transporter substrate-binding protein [Symbiobacteriaceae bacterium]
MRNRVVKGLAAVLALTVLAGCGAKTGSEQKPTTETKTQAPKVIKFNAGADFRTLDPGLMSDAVSGYAATQLYEGLVRTSEKGTQAGMAASWDILDNGTKFVFHLRDGIKWSNGDPVTAEDFVYAWTRVLDPQVASEYAYQLYYVKGGEAFNNVAAKIKGADGKEIDNPQFKEQLAAAQKNLGLKAVDAKTFEVTLEAPTPYFLELTAFHALMPVSKKAVEANKEGWAAKAATLVSNGPYKLTSWEPKKLAVLEKNPNYWNAGSVKVDKLEYYMIEETATALQLFESGQLDVMWAPPPPEIPRLEKEGKLQFAPAYNAYYYEFNTQKAPFNDVRVRKALAMAIDRKAIVTNVTKLNQKPAYGIVAVGAQDAAPGSDFRTVGGDLFKEDLAEAKKLLAEAGYPDGKGFPATEIYYNTLESHKMIAEATIEMWKKNLGITSIKATNMEFKVLLDRKQKGEHFIARAGWNGDYTDAMTFLDMWVTKGGNNTAFWSNAEYDALIKKAKSTGDQKVRVEAMHGAEKILMSEMPIIPFYFGRTPFLQSAKVTGVFREALGTIDFTNADVK